MPSSEFAALIEEFDRLIRRDPARRGLIGGDGRFGPLGVGQLALAAEHLAQHARHAALVTGFFVPHATPPAAETDGPPGTLLLAQALEALGVRTCVVTDSHCAGAVAAAAEAFDYDRSRLIVPPRDGHWIEGFFLDGPGRDLTHLIALERVGPSHTRASLIAQIRELGAPVELFEARVPVQTHGRCHNMRGQAIDEHTADLHRLFDEVRTFRPEAKTIGLGDGGNEIGMGSIPWEELVARLEGEHAVCIPCRVATDWNILAGTSNWGGYALAAAVLALAGREDVLRPWDREHQRQAIEHMVAHGPAVDGCTGRQEATVDGLPFLTYIQPWEGIRRLLGFPG
ncbi:MAG: DUF4392 domain-containing protein [Planctomycetes bacterium]|nr:DUF4392 domain-containing protein [Planctomycetota bacterium]